MVDGESHARQTGRVTEDFEWDDAKAAANFRKHRVGFADAVKVFDDPHEITTIAPDKSGEEDRYVTIGAIPDGRVLVVAFTFRGARISVISARRATRSERNEYEKRRFKS